MAKKAVKAIPLDQYQLAVLMAKAAIRTTEIVSATKVVSGGSRMPYALFTLIADNSAIFTVEVKRLARGA